MNKGIDILKVPIYDKFKCTADKCKFTCCEGWDISVNTDTYKKWKNENLSYILNNVKVEEYEGKKLYFVDKKIEEKCPFLDKSGLCEVVKNNGEDYLCSTCYSFPRVQNQFEDRREFSLSCACPEVEELISRERKINMTLKGKDIKSDLLELQVRDTLINILESDKFSLEYSFFIAFHMLSRILEDGNLTEENLLNCLDKYGNIEYLKNILSKYQDVNINRDEAIKEINYLFLDIIENYKEVPLLSSILQDLAYYGEKIDSKEFLKEWSDYKGSFEKHSKLIKDCIILKVLSNCVSDDIYDITASFQLIMVQYLLVRYALFLKYSMNGNKNIKNKDIKDYIVVFSRVIGNNAEAALEFFEESFDDEILEIGYLCYITLF